MYNNRVQLGIRVPMIIYSPNDDCGEGDRYRTGEQVLTEAEKNLAQMSMDPVNSTRNNYLTQEAIRLFEKGCCSDITGGD